MQLLQPTLVYNSLLQPSEGRETANQVSQVLLVLSGALHYFRYRVEEDGQAVVSYFVFDPRVVQSLDIPIDQHTQRR
jgi:hypothetical protein